MTRTAEVLMPNSVDEAVAAFGDGSGVKVIGGGTIVMPELARRQISFSRALILSEAGLSRIDRERGTVTIAAATPLEALIGTTPDPLSTAAQRIGDYELRGQATIGGNLCSGPGRDAPRGDLQAPLIALGAVVRSAGADGKQEQGVEDFLASGPDGRLVLEIEFPEPTRGVYVSMGRPHAHVFTLFGVACVESSEGTRVAIGGAGPVATRAASVEQALASGAPAVDAAAKVLDDVEPADDALASAWYRKKTLPTLVSRALSELSK
ncbi:MAG: FAD binding domain-containing protein, partial [Gaiellaceae bacterium]